MAAAKFSALEAALQVGSGAALFGVLYWSLYRTPRPSTPAAQQDQQVQHGRAAPQSGSESPVLQAIAEESQKTSGYYWKHGSTSHSLYRMQRLGSLVVLQPFKGGEVAGLALSADLDTGHVSETDHPKISSGFAVVYGIIGLVKLLGGHVLILVKQAEKVATLRGNPVFRISNSAIVSNASSKGVHADDKRYIALLEDAFDPNRSGRGLFISYGGDVTLTQQRYDTLAQDAAAAVKPLWARADPRFFWNRQFAEPLIGAGLDRHVLPVMLGSLAQVEGLSFGSAGHAVAASLTLIARRSLHRVGCRHWRRGIDGQGKVANFVETEQLVMVNMASGGVTSSYVQVRGSIPILWSQVPNIKYKPTTRVAPPSAYSPAFDRHAQDLLEAYKEVVAINLANQHGSEGVLSKAFADEAQRFAGASSGFCLVPFDFHKECGAASYHNLVKLWDAIKEDWARFGCYYSAPGKATERQQGVVRTNCIDCLDRTNVVQGMLGRKHLEAVLHRLGLLPPDRPFDTAYPKAEVIFKSVWADHGDDISRQYAGTGALKSGFTRTGKRTVWGLLDDGVKSMTRYYLNNFQDGRKQDALDFASGAYKPSPDAASPFQPQLSAAAPLLAVAASFLWGAIMLVRILRGQQQVSAVGATQMVVVPLLLSGVLLRMVARNGRNLVTKPQLLPQACQPW